METTTQASQGESAPKKRLFKHYPGDFGNLTVKVLHMDLDFNVYDERTEVTSQLHLKALTSLNRLTLNAKNLTIHTVTAKDRKIQFEYKKAEDKIIITFEDKVLEGEEIHIFTKTTCKPTKNTLEGLYYDVTPKGCPCTQITQCQQWGFQRIVPCIDDMTAKCTYTTTITASKEYTNILTNGDVSMPRENLENNRVKIVYENKKVPMATYLFFLGVGCYSTFSRVFEYPNGDSFTLELLVPPESNESIARKALDVLFDSVLWIHLFTGPNMYENWEKSIEIREKVYARENASKEAKESIRNELKEMVKDLKLGYKYTGEVYREIGMQNSDFGGMENVGNTTITTNRIMPFPEMTDAGIEYMFQVKIHEFYHNLNGSEVTGRSPFEIWLNEAVTVFIEQLNHEFLFGEDYTRLGTILTLHSPMGGTFAEDESVASMPIEPEGFNDPNELISSMTYVKAPEFVRMIWTLLGKENFMKALDLYHTRYKHSNASRAQWVQCMEEVFGSSLQEMASSWLKQTGFPILKVEESYDETKNSLSITTTQTTNNLWQFPFTLGIVGNSNTIEKTVFIKEKTNTFTFENIQKPFFLSLNRAGSFYGKVIHENEQLYKQAREDDDVSNRFLAFSKLANKQILSLMNNGDVDEEFLKLYFEILSDKKLTQSLGTLMLTIFESVDDPKLSGDYEGVFQAREKLLKTIASKYEKELTEMYSSASQEITGRYVDIQAKIIKQRQVKNLCLGLLSKLDTPKMHEIIKKQYYSADAASSRVLAFRYYLNSSASDKLALLDEEEEKSKGNRVRWETFLGVVGSLDSDDAVELIRRVEKSEYFDINQSNDQRALYASFARNKRKSLLTKEGREFMKEKLILLSSVNEYSAGSLLKPFGSVERMLEKNHAEVLGVLISVLRELKQDVSPSIYNTIVRMLLNAKNARAKYEAVHGEIPELKDFA